MDFSISVEQRAFVETVRKVCQKEFAPRAIRYLDGTWPAENMQRLGEIGVLGMAVPEAYGGSGLSVLDTVLVLEEIGKVCYVTAMAALGEVGTQTRIIATYAPESIKRSILPRVATGESILAICMKRPCATCATARLSGIRSVISRACAGKLPTCTSRWKRRAACCTVKR